MPPHDDAERQLKKLRAKEKLLAVVLFVIPLTATILYLIFLKNKASQPLLWVMIGLEWLVMLFVYLMVVGKMRRRRR